MTSSPGTGLSTSAAPEAPDRGWRSVGLLERDRDPPREIETLPRPTRRARDGGVVDDEARAAVAQRRPCRRAGLRRRHRCAQPSRQRWIVRDLCGNATQHAFANEVHVRDVSDGLQSQRAQHLQPWRRGRRRDGTERQPHGRAAPTGARSDSERMRHGAHHGQTVPDPGRVLTQPDASALVGHFDDEALAVGEAADADFPACLAAVGMNDRVGSSLGHAESDRLGYLVRSARRGHKLRRPADRAGAPSLYVTTSLLAFRCT